MVTKNDLWKIIESKLKENISKPSYETWLQKASLKELTSEQLIITVPDPFIKDWLDKRYRLFIKDVIYEEIGSDLEVLVEINEEENNEPIEEIPIHTKEKSNRNNGNLLNPKYTFETFVVGTTNRFAHAASLAVAEAPAQAYNPLFIYGGVGLGKTHLMQAIAHFVQEHHPNKNVMYLSSEKFTNEFINAIMDNKAESFRNKYRNVDILLVDDIQFLAGKEQTQEEFFHTFNTLHEENKQIIISSDRPPREIPTLEDRLRSRFEWGLITDISPPDLETRIAILNKKAKSEGLEDLPTDVILYIANQINTNIRELEGALIRVIAYSSLVNADIDVQLATEALKSIIPAKQPKKITIEGIKKYIAQKYNISINDINSKKRTRTIAFPRQIAMYISRELTDNSLPKIGDEFGGRDHTTVIHAHNKIMKMIKEDSETDSLINSFITDLKEQL